MSEVKIFEYYNGVYPINVYVCIDNRLDLICNKFKDSEGRDLVLDEFTKSKDVQAFVVPNVTFKKSGEGGMLIVFKRKSAMYASVMAHEAFHAASMILDLMGVTYNVGDTNEAFAYLIGWIVGCCEDVKNHKPKKREENGEEDKD